MKSRQFLFLIASLFVIVAAGFILTPANFSGNSSTTATTTTVLGTRTKTDGCLVRDKLPDPDCTPGAIFPNATVSRICTPGYSTSVREVPQSEKDEVYAAYGITHHQPYEYEVDHLISLELGGSNDIANLWPEAAEPRPGYHEKDMVENYLHQEICSGRTTLAVAQDKISHHWLEIYSKLSL